MIRIVNGAVSIQTPVESASSTPSWFGEVVVMVARRQRA